MPQPTNVTNQLDLHKNLHNAVHDVKMYGAVGDGVTDDTSAIQAAITGSGWPANRATILLRGDGYYKLNSTGIVLSGGGGTSTPELTVLGNGARVMSSAASSSPLIDVTNSIVSTTYITLDGITFLPNPGNTAPYRTAIRLTNAEATNITGCAFVGNYGTGIDIASLSNYNRITNNTFFSLSRGITFSGTGSYTTINNNTFGEGLVGNPLNWIDANNGGAPTDQVTLSGNIFYSTGATLGAVRVTQGKGWTFTGNQFFVSAVESIRLGNNASSEAHNIVGNVFRQGRQHDIFVDGAQRNVIVGNTFMERFAGTAADTYNAVHVLNTFGGAAGHHNVIMGNVSTDTSTGLDQVVKLAAACDYCTVVGNIGAAGFTAAGANNQVANNITH